MSFIIRTLLPVAIRIISGWIKGKNAKSKKDADAIKKWHEFVESIDYGRSAKLKEQAEISRERLREEIRNSKISE